MAIAAGECGVVPEGILRESGHARHEYKYLVEDAAAAAVRAAIRPFCALDPHSSRPGMRYPIQSLYFDTPDLRLYRATEDGLERRFKARVRRYDEAAGAPVWLEVKRRAGDLFWKSRGEVRGDWAALLRDPTRPAPPSGTREGDAAIETFRLALERHRLVPAMLVRYDREAYEGMMGHHVRVTLDRRIAFQAPRGAPGEGPTLDASPSGWRAADGGLGPLGEGLSVLEVKFGVVVPLWLPEVIARLDLRRRGFSKYATSVRGARARPTLRVPRRAP